MLRYLRNIRAGDHVSGFQFTLTNQIFHGTHPLGWIRSFRVDVDGGALPPDTVDFVIRHQAIPSYLLPEISDIWWQPRESVVIAVRLAGGLRPGKHRLGCDFQLASIIFTPSIDRRNVYRTMPGRIEANLDLAIATEGQAA
jgi:hypothetical protein